MDNTLYRYFVTCLSPAYYDIHAICVLKDRLAGARMQWNRRAMKAETIENTSTTDVKKVLLKRRREIIARIDGLRDELATIDEALNKLDPASSNKYALLEKVLVESHKPLAFKEILERMEAAGYRPGNRDRRGSVSYLLYGRQKAPYVRRAQVQGKQGFWHVSRVEEGPGG